MKNENSLYWVWLAERCGVASKDFGRLIVQYKDPFELYRMEEDEIERIECIGDRLKYALCDKSLESAYSILRYCKGNKVDVISYYDTEYPARLRTIEDPPVLLYVLGKLPNMDDRLCVGIVGTRKMSEYGAQTAYKISYELAAANAVIVSGMALGVDGVAACGALASGGKTVAVLGCGISVIYPKEHKRLMDAIAVNGAVVTEYPPTEPPRGANFPRRNRLISGFCQSVLIVEGAIGSGALITAQRAIDQGREVFALPGKINESNSDGPNELIQQGAYVALSADDIICHYDFLYRDTIYYDKLRKAQKDAVPIEVSLDKYGVSSSYSKDHKGRSKRSAVSDKPSQDLVPQMPDVSAENTVDTVKSSEKKKIKNKDISSSKKTAKSEESTQSETARRALKPEVLPNLLSGLDNTTRSIFENMPTGRAVSPDALQTSEFGISDIITALTLLEIYGLVKAMPGGTYLKNEDI